MTKTFKNQLYKERENFALTGDSWYGHCQIQLSSPIFKKKRDFVDYLVKKNYENIKTFVKLPPVACRVDPRSTFRHMCIGKPNILHSKDPHSNLPMKSSLERWSLSQTLISRICPVKSCWCQWWVVGSETKQMPAESESEAVNWKWKCEGALS